MGKKRYIPRWIHSRVVLPGTTPVTLDPEVFMNKTSWPFRIEYLSIFGHEVDSQETPGTGGLGPYVNADIGISGSTDINLVPGQLPVSFFNTRNYEIGGALMYGRYFRLARPYLLPRDGGFSVECTYDLSDTGVELRNITNMKYGVSLIGRRIQTNEPVMFACLHRYLDIPDGSSFTIDAADLLNNGEDDVEINSIQYMFDTKGMDTDPMGLYYKVNPLSGLTWMDNPVHLSGLTPYLLDARGDQHTFVLTPHKDTFLYRRQRLGVTLTGLVEESQPVNVTLFGYLEVE